MNIAERINKIVECCNTGNCVECPDYINNHCMKYIAERLEEPQTKFDIYYIVALKDCITDTGFYNTTVYSRFCGKLVNQNDSNFYFELNSSNALVIIPHSWIKWMAPSKVHWDMQRKKDK